MMLKPERCTTIVLLCTALVVGCGSSDPFDDEAGPLIVPDSQESSTRSASTASPPSPETAADPSIPSEPTTPVTAPLPDEPTIPATTDLPNEPTTPPTTGLPDEPPFPTTTIAATPINWDQACREQYDFPDSYARADEDVHTAWTCYFLTDDGESELGGIDVDRYCNDRGLSSSLQPELGRDGWRCEPS